MELRERHLWLFFGLLLLLNIVLHSDTALNDRVDFREHDKVQLLAEPSNPSSWRVSKVGKIAVQPTLPLLAEGGCDLLVKYCMCSASSREMISDLPTPR